MNGLLKVKVKKKQGYLTSPETLPPCGLSPYIFLAFLKKNMDIGLGRKPHLFVDYVHQNVFLLFEPSL